MSIQKYVNLPSHKYYQPDSECIDCKTFIQKIGKVEKALLSKDEIVDVLHTQVSKYQIAFKKLFREFEKLKFSHSSALQENSSLKSLYSQLEEQTFQKNSCCTLSSGRRSRSSDNQIIKEVTNIEQLIINQNHILYDLKNRFLNGSKPDPKVEQGDHLNLNPATTSILNCCEHLESYDKKCGVEQPNRLCTYTIVSSNLKTKLSDKTCQIDYYTKSNQTSTRTPSIQIFNSKYSGPAIEMANERNEEEIRRLESKLAKTSECNCDLFAKLEEINQNNQLLTETLSIVTAENKNNSELVEKLKREIDCLIEENEGKINKMQEKLDSTEQELKESRQSVQQYSMNIKAMEDEANNLRNKMGGIVGEVDVLKGCKCDVEAELLEQAAENQALQKQLANNVMQMNELESQCMAKCDKMRKEISGLNNEVAELRSKMELQRKSLVQVEQEKEELSTRCQSLCQENTQLQEGQDKLQKELQRRSMENNEIIEKFKSVSEEKQRNQQRFSIESNELKEQLTMVHTQAEMYTSTIDKQNQSLEEALTEIENLKHQLQALNGEQAKLKKGNCDLENEIKLLQSTLKAVKTDLEEKNLEIVEYEEENKSLQQNMKTLSDYNDNIQQRMEELQRELNDIKTIKKSNLACQTEHTSQDIVSLQNQVQVFQTHVAELLEEHDKKSAQVQEVAEELERMKTQSMKDVQEYTRRISELERERERERESIRPCTCNIQEGLHCLSQQLEKKDHIIGQLENTIDSFQQSLEAFEETSKQLVCENDFLKSDRAQRIEDLGSLQTDMEKTLDELDKIRSQMIDARKGCEKCVAKQMQVDDVSKKLLHLECKCQAVELENKVLKGEVEQFKIKTKKKEKSDKVCETTDNMPDLQSLHDELKVEYNSKILEVESLKSELEKSQRELNSAKLSRNGLQEEHDRFKRHSGMSAVELLEVKADWENAKQEHAAKCAEVSHLKKSVNHIKEDKLKTEECCRALRVTMENKDDDIKQLKQKVQEMGRSLEEKTNELKKFKKQCESCAKQSQITREEYINLRKEYKEIKSMLAEQLGKFKTIDASTDASLENQEKKMTGLQAKLKEASYEIIELKDYVQKLIGDNAALKSAISNLIGNLERKITGTSVGSLPSRSMENLAGEILGSLGNIEDIMQGKGHCLKGCLECDCMKEILDKYDVTKDTTNPKSIVSISEKNLTKMSDSSTTAVHCAKMVKTLSEPFNRIKGLRSDTSTSDSDV